MVYVHEGHKEESKNGERKELIHAYYFCGTYKGSKRNEELWEEVKKYIQETYELEKIEKIYFQSDGGSWMKKEKEVLDCEFVLEEFHLEK